VEFDCRKRPETAVWCRTRAGWIMLKFENWLDRAFAPPWMKALKAEYFAKWDKEQARVDGVRTRIEQESAQDSPEALMARVARCRAADVPEQHINALISQFEARKSARLKETQELNKHQEYMLEQRRLVRRGKR
ncbi:MAG: hypothetical protein ABI574_13680, partial [Burkholderiales bacterium]